MQKNRDHLGNWLNAQIELGFDSMQHSRNGCDVTILWEPFPVVATHKIVLDAAALRSVSVFSSNLA